jgi:hypothetical protein
MDTAVSVPSSTRMFVLHIRYGTLEILRFKHAVLGYRTTFNNLVIRNLDGGKILFCDVFKDIFVLCAIAFKGLKT